MVAREECGFVWLSVSPRVLIEDQGKRSVARSLATPSNASHARYGPALGTSKKQGGVVKAVRLGFSPKNIKSGKQLRTKDFR